MKKFILLLMLSVFPVLTLFSQQEPGAPGYPPARHYDVAMARSQIKIDGRLEEEAWKKAVSIPLPYEWSPGDNVPAPVETRCLITFSRTHLYIAFRCHDPAPGKIRAHLMDRDNIDTFVLDDHISIILDTFNDQRRGFQFRVNPLGVQADAVFSTLEGYEDFSWDAIWRSAGKIDNNGYTLEIAIPFNQLRFKKTPGKQTWGFSAERSYPRRVRHRLASHVRARGSGCLMCQFNKLTGFEAITPGRSLEFDPTMTLQQTDTRNDFPAGPMETGKIDWDPGITAKWGVTSNIILNAAVNPDFSQVEADVAQLDVNNRFALRYPEKRPFFLEGADLFLTPLEAVFTRTVYDPAWGVKASGKLGRSAIGVFAAHDRVNNLIFPSNQGSRSASLDRDVFGGVLRFRQDIGNGSTFGVLYAGRSGEDYYNHVAGFDGFVRLSRRKNMSFQYLYSRTQYPGDIAETYGQDSQHFGGNAWRANFEHYGRNLNYFITYTSLSPGFRADYGFIPRVDTRQVQAVFIPMIWGKRGGWFNRISFMLRGTGVTDHEDNLTNREFEVNARYEGPLETVFQPAFSRVREVYNGMDYDLDRFDIYFNMKPLNGVQLFFQSRVGDAVDYWNSRPAQQLMINPGIEIGLGRHLNINLNHLYERLSLDGNNIYTANLFQGRFVYNFNVRTFVRAIFQYTHIERDTGMYVSTVDPVTKGLFTQLLFSYKINPKTVLFLGYSDNHSGLKTLDLTRTDRTFFLKIGYALAL